MYAVWHKFVILTYFIHYSSTVVNPQLSQNFSGIVITPTRYSPVLQSKVDALEQSSVVQSSVSVVTEPVLMYSSIWESTVLKQSKSSSLELFLHEC